MTPQAIAPDSLESLPCLQWVVRCNKAVADVLRFGIDCAADFDVASTGLKDLQNWFERVSVLEPHLKMSLDSAKGDRNALKKLKELKKRLDQPAPNSDAKSVKPPAQSVQKQPASADEKPPGRDELADNLKKFLAIPIAEFIGALGAPDATDVQRRLTAARETGALYAEEFRLPELVKNGGGECPVWKWVTDELLHSEKYIGAVLARAKPFLRKLLGSPHGKRLTDRERRERIEELLTGVLWTMERIVIGKAQHFLDEVCKLPESSEQTWLDRALFFGGGRPRGGTSDITRAITDLLGIKRSRTTKSESSAEPDTPAMGRKTPKFLIASELSADNQNLLDEKAAPEDEQPEERATPKFLIASELSADNQNLLDEKAAPEDEQPEERAMQKEHQERQKARKEAMMSQLPPRLRQALELRLKGMTYQEVADAINNSAEKNSAEKASEPCTANAARLRCESALEKLKEQFGPSNPGDPKE